MPNAKATPATIQGTLSISNSVAHTLIDSSATHSFVSLNFFKQLFVKSKLLDKTLVVETASKDILVSSKVYKSSKIKVAYRESVVDLLFLDFPNFDVILGMDWLAIYHANLDCFSKTVTLNPPNTKPYSLKAISKINKNHFASVFTQSYIP